MPSNVQPPHEPLINVLIRNIRNLSGNQDASPQVTTDITPDQWGQGQRKIDRQGLPGQTPLIDPRLVDPKNNPMTSAAGMMRGDINLPPQGSGQKPVEDPSRALKLIETLKRLGITR
jgi:hypothetical protein